MSSPPAPAHASCEDLAERYLELLKRCLCGGSYRAPLQKKRNARWGTLPPLRKVLGSFRLELVRRVAAEAAAEGKDYASDGQTMLGQRRLDNLQFCITDVLRRGVPGEQRKMSTPMRHLLRGGFIEWPPPLSASGLLIQLATGSAGGAGALRTNRSGLVA